MNEREAKAVHAGNACLHSLLRVLMCAEKFSMRWIFENPASSRMWLIPQAQKFGRRRHVNESVADFCA